MRGNNPAARPFQTQDNHNPKASATVPDAIRAQMIQILPRLRSFARSLARVPDQADDLVQQTCEKALRNLDGFTPGTRLDSWMFRIMRNAWIDTQRARRDTVPLTDAAGDDGPGVILPGEDGRRTVLARLQLSEVRGAIARLPEDQRSVLLLVCVEGIRYREVAEALEIPMGTVMSRLGRARAALLRAVEDEPQQPPREERT